jgi:hypothetical protein
MEVRTDLDLSEAAPIVPPARSRRDALLTRCTQPGVLRPVFAVLRACALRVAEFPGPHRALRRL